MKYSTRLRVNVGSPIYLKEKKKKRKKKKERERLDLEREKRGNNRDL